MPDQRSQALAALITAGRVVREENLHEAMKLADKMSVPLEKAIGMYGFASDNMLDYALRLLKMCERREINLEIAKNAAQNCYQRHMDLEEAVSVAVQVYKDNQPKKFDSGELIKLMSAAEMVSHEQMRVAALRAKETGVLEGRLLRLNRELNNNSLGAAITALLEIQNGGLTREIAVEALALAHKKNISLEQALFEQDKYKQPAVHELKLSDLLTMSGLILDSDRLECMEERVVTRVAFGDIVVGKGLVSTEGLYLAKQLHQKIAKEQLAAYVAIDLLRNFALGKHTALDANTQADKETGLPVSSMRLGELLVKVGACTQAQIDKVEQPSNIKIGQQLQASGAIDATTLSNSLRIQSLLKFGCISEEQAEQILKEAIKSKTNLDQVLLKMNKYLPTAMQWSWV